MADVVVAGAAGRMGSRLVALLQEGKDLRLVAAIEAPGHPAVSRDAGEVAGVGRLGVPITDDPESVLGQERILVEFSVPAASLSHLQSIARLGGRAVIGTTGLSGAERQEVQRLARTVPILLSPNMSVGVNVAFRVLSDMARMLGDDTSGDQGIHPASKDPRATPSDGRGVASAGLDLATRVYVASPSGDDARNRPSCRSARSTCSVGPRSPSAPSVSASS